MTAVIGFLHVFILNAHKAILFPNFFFHMRPPKLGMELAMWLIISIEAGNEVKLPPRKKCVCELTPLKLSQHMGPHQHPSKDPPLGDFYLFNVFKEQKGNF